MDGGDLIRVVQERFPETASLILTGYPDQAPTEHPPRLITKPWDDAELKETIRALVRQRRGLGEIAGGDPLDREPKGRLLVVAEDSRVRFRAGAAAGVAGFDIHVAIHADEGLRLIRELHPAVELVVLDSRIPAWPLRSAIPGAAFVVLAEAPASEDIRRWYDMGIEQVVRMSVSTPALVLGFQRCLQRVRTARRDSELQALDGARRAADPWWKRARRSVLGWMQAPARSRTGERRILLGFAAAAVLIGILLGITWRGIQRIPLVDFPGGAGDPMTHLWRMSAQDQALRRWYMLQQLDIDREIQAETRRYHDLQLKPSLPAPERQGLPEPGKR
jgi:DNA-binding response OmpR family regulator